MKQIITQFFSEYILALPFLIVTSYFYKKISNKNAPYRADIDAYRNIGLSRGFWYHLWLIFFTPLLFLYNLFVDTIWFIFEIIHYVVLLFSTIWNWIKWIWFELIWPGLNFIMLVIIYYLFIWPWQYVQLVFKNLTPIASFTYFIAGLLGTGSALIVVHIGRFIDYVVNNDTPLAMLSSSVIATSLLAFGSGIISSMLRSNSNDGGWKTIKSHFKNGKKSALYILTIAFLSVLLISIEWGFWRTGWIHQWGNLIGGVLSGTTILMAMISFLNFMVLSFALSLGSHFILDNTFDFRKNTIPFIKLALRNLGALIFTIPWTLINALILSVIPVIIIIGTLFISQKINFDIQKKQEQRYIKYISKRNWINTVNYNNLSDIQFNDYLLSIQELAEGKQDFIRQKNWGSQILKLISFEKTDILFTPVKGFSSYDTTVSRLKIKLKKLQQDSTDLFNKIKNNTASSSEIINEIESQLQTINLVLDRFRKKQNDSTLSAQWNADSTIDIKYKFNTEEQFNEILKQLNDKKEKYISSPEIGKRKLRILNYECNFINREIKETSKAKWFDAVGYLLLGIFYALLIAFVITMAWVSFVAVWYAIYMKDKLNNNEPIRLKIIWNEINSKNKNQPLLSILFLLIFALPLLIINKSLYSNKLNSFNSIQDITGSSDLDSIYSEPYKINEVQVDSPDLTPSIEQNFSNPVEAVIEPRAIEALAPVEQVPYEEAKPVEEVPYEEAQPIEEAPPAEDVD